MGFSGGSAQHKWCRSRAAESHQGQHAKRGGVDGAVAARGPGEVAAEAAEAQMVGGPGWTRYFRRLSRGLPPGPGGTIGAWR
jgi:hypothetical protein